MKVFISWSGNRSKALAEGLREMLPLVLHYVEPWLSGADIDAGERWTTEIGRELQESDFGLLCLTRENLNAPWILFEAGALAKSLDKARVVPLLFDIDFSDVTFPLAQFQAKKFEKKGIYEVVQSVNAIATNAVLANRIDRLFEMAWHSLSEAIKAVPKSKIGGPTRSTHELLDELITTVRSIDQRTRDLEITAIERIELVRPSRDLERIIPKEILRNGQSLVNEGKIIDAIRMFRVHAKINLAEAKYLVECLKGKTT